MTLPQPFDVAIVGGGASGTLLAIQLLRSAKRALRLVLVDREGDFARGIAYRTLDAEHLLNVPAARMSALPQEEGHFLAWLRAREASAGPDSYARREQYGDYLTELLQQQERQAPSGTRLERRKAEVRDVEDSAEGLRLNLGQNSDLLAHHAVLALGNPPPAPLPISPASSPRVWQMPWPQNANWPDRDASVLLVGAGLTAIDLILSLSARGHRGPLHILSRHGLLPNAHQATTQPPLELFLPRGGVRPLFAALRVAARGASSGWQPVIDGVRPHAHELWRSLNDKERRRFARHARTHWEVHRHRLAPSAERVLGKLLKSKQLHVHAGRLLRCVDTASGLHVHFRPRGKSSESELVVALAVNCTGPAGHSTHADTLVSALLRKGLARSGPLGLGLATAVNGALLDAEGRASGKLWALGPVRRGDVWESTAVPDIRLQAAALSEQLKLP